MGKETGITIAWFNGELPSKEYLLYNAEKNTNSDWLYKSMDEPYFFQSVEEARSYDASINGRKNDFKIILQVECSDCGVLLYFYEEDITPERLDFDNFCCDECKDWFMERERILSER